MIQSAVEFFRNLPKKQCPQCGQTFSEQAESYLMECEACSSKNLKN
jgi:protein-arginine kinase activator protein McsA